MKIVINMIICLMNLPMFLLILQMNQMVPTEEVPNVIESVNVSTHVVPNVSESILDPSKSIPNTNPTCPKNSFDPSPVEQNYEESPKSKKSIKKSSKGPKIVTARYS